MRYYNIEIRNKDNSEIRLEYVTSAIDKANVNEIARDLEREIFGDSKEFVTKINQISEEEYLKHF